MAPRVAAVKFASDFASGWAGDLFAIPRVTPLTKRGGLAARRCLVNKARIAIVLFRVFSFVLQTAPATLLFSIKFPDTALGINARAFQQILTA